VPNGTTYYYLVTASDESANESTESSQESGTPMVPVRVAWINEIHYDNTGGDVVEFVEIAGTADLNLTGWSIVAYNGADGLVYNTLALSGSIKEQEGGFGTQGFLMPGLQNDVEGLALVDNYGEVYAFISYEGSFMAMDGPAVGMNSEDIGISESDTTTSRSSLQLMGNGNVYRAFHWGQPGVETRNRLNRHQRFTVVDYEMERQ